jgi:hypothetical protein
MSLSKTDGNKERVKDIENLACTGLLAGLDDLTKNIHHTR